MFLKIVLLLTFIWLAIIFEATAQDFDVSDIQCSFSTPGSNVGDLITARLKRPLEFKGTPLFGDDRSINPDTDNYCTIKRDLSDASELTFNLRITNFSKCGVLKRNGFVHVRIWFPQFLGVVMRSDQELIIMCKPPEPIVIGNRSAGFAGSFPHGARVSGIVEESPGRLEYEITLYKEAPPIARISEINTQFSSTNDPPIASELAVDQAVPIGTKLQLRAKISSQSVWKYIKFLEVTVSPDPDNPHAKGAVLLVEEGCRNEDYIAIIPHQPAKYRNRSNEVFLDFESFLLSSMKERATLWIHSQIKACMDSVDCVSEFCKDDEPSGHGRQRRNMMTPSNKSLSRPKRNISEFTRFKENIEYTVLISGESEQKQINQNEPPSQCRAVVFIIFFLLLLIAICVGLICLLAHRIQTYQKAQCKKITSVLTTNYARRSIVP